MTQNEKDFLKNYDKNKYEKPSVTTDIIVLSTDESLTALRVLLIQRKKHPFKDNWAIPGGFLDIHESLEDGARRELKEETNVDAPYLMQIGAFGDADRDPRMRIISVAYLSLIKNSLLTHVQAGDDAKKAEWFLIHKSKDNKLLLEHENSHQYIEPSQLAFDHQTILMSALESIRKEVTLNPKTAEHLIDQSSDFEKALELLKF